MKWTWLALGCALAVGCNDSGGNVDGGGGGDGGNGSFAILSRTVALAVGSTECDKGGTRVDIGLDNGDGGGIARNNTLEDGEVDTSQTLCNPSLTEFATVTKTTNVPQGSSDCAFGGSLIEYGLDNGDGGGTPNNGVLEAGEKDGQTFACLPQPNSLLVTAAPILPGDADCPFGGTTVMSGYDDGTPSGTANNGTLEAGEVDLNQKRCNADPATLFPGVDGEVGTSTIDTHGGLGTGNGSGGSGGSIFVQAAGGPLPTALDLHKKGALAVTTTPPAVTVNAGANSLIVTSNTTVPSLATKPADTTNQIYLLADESTDQSTLYFGDSPATSVQVQPGVTMTLATTALSLDVVIAGDVRNQGTITTKNGDGAHVGLRLACASFFNDATGFVDQRGAAFALYASAVVANRGKIFTRGYDRLDVITTLPEDADGDTDDSTATHNPNGSGAWLVLAATKNVYNSGTISSRGSRAFRVTTGDANGGNLVLYTQTGNVENDGTIEAIGGYAQHGGTGGNITIGNDFVFDQTTVPSEIAPPATITARAGRLPGSLANQGVITASGGSCAGSNTDLCVKGGDAGSLTIFVAGGNVRATGVLRAAGGAPRQGAGGAGNSLSVIVVTFVAANGDVTPPGELALGATLDTHGEGYTGAANVSGGSGGSITIYADAATSFYAFDPAKLTALMTTKKVRATLVGYGGGVHLNGGGGTSTAGNGGNLTLWIAPCGGESSQCAYTKTGEHWLFSDLDVEQRGGNNGAGGAGIAGSTSLLSFSASEIPVAVTGASSVELHGIINSVGGDGYAGGTATGGRGGTFTINSDTAKIVCAADVDASGGAAKGTAGAGGNAGSVQVNGFDVHVVGDLVANAGKTNAGQPGSGDVVEVNGYRVTVDGELSANGNGQSLVRLQAADTLTLNGNITSNSSGLTASGTGFAGGSVDVRAVQGTGNGTITLNGASLTNNAFAGNQTAGAGGAVRITGSWNQIGNVTARGGDCSLATGGTRGCTGGKGGSIAVTGVLTTSAAWNVSGGNATLATSTGAARGGDGGRFENEVTNGGNTTSTGAITANGGNATGTTVAQTSGGDGGVVEVFSSSAAITCNGGAGSGTNASGGDGGSITTTVNTGCATVAGGAPAGSVGNVFGPNQCL